MSKNIINPFGSTFEIEVDNYLGVKKCTVAFPDRKDFYLIIQEISEGKAGAEYSVGEKLLLKFVEGDSEFMTDDIYILLGSIKCVAEFEKRAEFIKKN